jgi:hypothetical protein
MTTTKNNGVIVVQNELDESKELEKSKLKEDLSGTQHEEEEEMDEVNVSDEEEAEVEKDVVE